MSRHHASVSTQERSWNTRPGRDRVCLRRIASVTETSGSCLTNETKRRSNRDGRSTPGRKVRPKKGKRRREDGGADQTNPGRRGSRPSQHRFAATELRVAAKLVPRRGRGGDRHDGPLY